MRFCYLDCHEAGLCGYLVIYRKLVTSITGVLFPFVTYLLALHRTINIGTHSAYNGIPDLELQSSLYLDRLRTQNRRTQRDYRVVHEAGSNQEVQSLHYSRRE
jgi:hypothetical protein